MNTRSGFMVCIAVLTFLASGCKSTDEGGPREKSAEEKASLTLLQKIDEGKMPRAVVALFEDTSEVTKAKVDLSGSIADILSKSGRVTIASRGKKMSGVLEEMELSLMGLTENSAEVGKVLGADIILFGRIVNASEQKEDKFAFDLVTILVQIEVQGIEASTGRVLFTHTAKGTAETKVYTTSDTGTVVSGAVNYDNLYIEASEKAVKNVSEWLIYEFPLIGFVLEVKDGLVTTDLGGKYNVANEEGVTFVRKGAVVKHPATGAIISYKKEVVGEGKIVSFDNETCVVKVKGKATVTPGDLAVYNK